MKSLRTPYNHEQSEYMRQRREQNSQRCSFSGAENWFHEQLTVGKWKRQHAWGYRVFDFWCQKLGCAVEVDGPEHAPSYDAYRDEYNFRRSGIVVLRVRNFNTQDAAKCLETIRLLGTWEERREQLGLQCHTKKGKRHLSSQPFDHSMLREYVDGLSCHEDVHGRKFF